MQERCWPSKFRESCPFPIVSNFPVNPLENGRLRRRTIVLPARMQNEDIGPAPAHGWNDWNLTGVEQFAYQSVVRFKPSSAQSNDPIRLTFEARACDGAGRFLWAAGPLATDRGYLGRSAQSHRRRSAARAWSRAERRHNRRQSKRLRRAGDPTAEYLTNLLKSLVRPTGIEPVFSP